jgi:hemolysin activation/secretion protein
MQIGVRAWRASLLACSVLWVAPFTASAQTTPPPASPPPVPSREEIDPSQRLQQSERQRRREADLFARPDAGPCPLRSSALTFTLQSVTFNGVTAATPEELARTYAGEIGRTVPVASICDIRDRAAELLFSKGVLARVEIPEQRIEEGRLALEVIEARVVSVRVRGDAGPAQAKVEAYLERLRGLQPFDLDVAQRYLLLASDVPGVQLQASLRPSSQGRGAVDLEVNVSRDPVDVVVNAQNFGSRSIGRWGGLVRTDFDGFTPYGDRTSVVLYSTLESDEQRIIQVLEELRIGDDGWLARGSLAYARTKPGDVLEELGLESDSFVANIEAAYPLIRKRRRNLNLLAGLDYVNQETTVEGAAVLTDDRVRVVYGRVEGNARSWLSEIPTEASLGFELRKGLDILDASQAGAPTLSRLEGNPEATVWRVDAQADFQLPARFGAGVALQAQFTDEPLLSYEQITIGNLTIGRGYDPSSVTGDRGMAASFELRAGPFPVTPWLQAQGFGFYDAARVEDLSVNGEERTVRSTGAGVRFSARHGGRQYNLDVVYAQPLDKTSDLAASKPSSRVLVNLTASLY